MGFAQHVHEEWLQGMKLFINFYNAIKNLLYDI